MRMNILALDIGGTSSRFGHCVTKDAGGYEIVNMMMLETQRQDVQSFQDLLSCFESEKPSPFLDVDDYDLIAIAIAGPVIEQRAYPPNIKWNIDLRDYNFCKVSMINDFVAQAHALYMDKPSSLTNLRVPKSNNISADNKLSAVLGPGTGFGNCTVLDNGTIQKFIPSEFGQTNFPFLVTEFDLADDMRQAINVSYLTYDHILSGTGLSFIHAYFSQEQLEPAAIFEQECEQTLHQFAVFLGRACRNLCLANCINDRLIISGGIIAKHGTKIVSDAFFREFDDCPSHSELLGQIQIQINHNEYCGLEGILHYITTKNAQ